MIPSFHPNRQMQKIQHHLHPNHRFAQKLLTAEFDHQRRHHRTAVKGPIKTTDASNKSSCRIHASLRHSSQRSPAPTVDSVSSSIQVGSLHHLPISKCSTASRTPYRQNCRTATTSTDNQRMSALPPVETVNVPLRSERVNLVRLTVNTVRTITRVRGFGSTASDYGCVWLAG